MMIFKKSHTTLNWLKTLLFVAGATACFHIAYFPRNIPALPLFAAGYVVCLTQLARLKTARLSFYIGLATSLFCVGPQLECFWRIFGSAAVPLWCILAFWIAVFVMVIHLALVRFGPLWTALFVPFVWTGLEYFRSELYYLKFSWLNIGYAFAGWQQRIPFHQLGMYGVGFVFASFAALPFALRWRYAVTPLIVLGAATLFSKTSDDIPARDAQFHVAGVQMEFPVERGIPLALNRLFAKHPDAELLVLSEYTLDGPVPESLKTWCRMNHRYLIVGGKDPAPNGNYYDTAFVIGPDGKIVFRQGKSVPIQFFKDGLPAPQQTLWNSPWGKIGICICYDLSYTRVTDPLVKMGAQMLVVPTMDVVDWGMREHELHALVAPVRAAEYGIPIFRLASSGISQAVDEHGEALATARFRRENEGLVAGFRLPESGSLPWDRCLAPLCVAFTGLLIAILVCSNWTRRNTLKKIGFSNVVAHQGESV
jgi:apolipoprotein N-acyltransferase